MTIHTLILLRIERAAQQRLDLMRSGPHLAQVDLSPLDNRQRLARQIEIDASGNGEGDHQWRAHEKVRLQALVNARLEVTIAREHADAEDVALHERFFDFARQRT